MIVFQGTNILPTVDNIETVGMKVLEGSSYSRYAAFYYNSDSEYVIAFACYDISPINPRYVSYVFVSNIPSGTSNGAIIYSTTPSSGLTTTTFSNNVNGLRGGSLSYSYSDTLVSPAEVDSSSISTCWQMAYDAVVNWHPPSVSVPITYYPTGCVLQGPSEAEQGDTVNVLVTPGPGKIIKPESIQVYNRSGLITHTYASGILSFNVPDGQ